MKGHKAHHHRKGHAKGGSAHEDTGTEKGHWEESAETGVDEADQDLHDKPEQRNNAKKIFGESEARKRGGRTARKHGGHVHHEAGKHLAHAKHLGNVHGEHGGHHAGRKPRKAGGRAGADMHPFSSAMHGSLPKGRKVENISMGNDKE